MALYPLTFQPILKERVWGGRKLEELYNKPLPPGLPIGESWEISDRPGDVSIIANGSFAGKDLHWLLEHHRAELLGSAILSNGRFPLLVKLLDAQEKLSLQVHPPAAKAAALGGEPKTELWYIAHASPEAELYIGLRRGCTRAEFAQKIRAGTVAECFHRVRVQAGDAMFLPSGRVHALGAGLVIFEIQQNSDTTFRVFDWNRVGLDGKARALHINESLESIDFEDFEPNVIRPQLLDEISDSSVLIADPLFKVELMQLPAGSARAFGPGAMLVLGLISGALSVNSTGGDLRISSGQFCLLPAVLSQVAVRAERASVFLSVQPGNENQVRS
jgi:mannose-6-phosphate isomerase